MGLGPTRWLEDARTVYTHNVCPSCAVQPNISDFKILRVVDAQPYMLVEVKYGNTTTYEGRKVMIVRMTPVALMNARALDPHFKQHGNVVARFEPTPTGWTLAEQVLATLTP